MSEETYKTILVGSEGIFRDKGSKFIAYARPFSSEEDLKDVLQEIKAEHPKARHHCWAYRLTPDRTVFRANDDGEPSGSAGRPILNVLLSFDVTNIIVVVVRYFGGTLLGVPGLINAYKTASQEALAAAEIIEKTSDEVYSISFDYLQMNDVMRTIKEHSLDILEQEFDNRCLIKLAIPKAELNAVFGKLEGLDGLEMVWIKTR